MLEIYIKYFDNNYYLLDLKGGEGVNLKTVYRDLNDISKIYSPYTQSFKIPATDKNKILTGFLGKEKTANYGFDFDAKIYISGFLFQTGKLSFTDFEDGEYTATFGSTISGLVETIGDLTIQDLFADAKLKIEWNLTAVKNYLQGITNRTMANGVTLSFGVPFISNIRTWIYNTNLNIVDNIAYNKNALSSSENFIKLSEVRPSITYATILNQIIKKFGLNVICPILSRPEITELYAYCNTESLLLLKGNYELSGFSNIAFRTYDDLNQISNNNRPPAAPKFWVNLVNSKILNIVRNTSALDLYNDYWQLGFNISVRFNSLVSLDGTETRVKIRYINSDTNVLIKEEILTNKSQYDLFINDRGVQLPGGSYGFEGNIPSSGTLNIKFEILPETLVSWSSIDIFTTQSYRQEKKTFGVTFVDRKKYEAKINLTTPSSQLGGDLIDLIDCLPQIKTIDFLKSFFKTFNISIIASGKENNEMHWVTPSDILAQNQEYSKRLVDYTFFTNKENITKKKANKYNQYSFSHKKSKYYESLYGDGTYFGSLIYPTITPTKPTKFEVSTDYSIIKQSNFSTFNNVRTCLAFEKEGATVQANGGNRYKSVFEEFTIFYLKQKSLGNQTVGFEYSTINNIELKAVLEANFVNYTNGKTLSFGEEFEGVDSLYLNYYKDFIENLFNAYESTFNLNLPSNEIFLNFSNQKQGESNIPIGFRPQNDIIIAEQRYSLIDSAIDLTNGKTKLTLLND